MSGGPTGVAGRLLSLVTRLYPRAFRQRFRGDLLALYEVERRRVLEVGGGWAAARHALRTIVATLWGVALEWLHERLPGRSVPVGERTERRRGMGAIDVVRIEAGHALRSLRRSPGFTAVVVVTLGLGAGANAAMFELADRLLVRAPKYLRDSSDVHRLYIARTINDARRLDGSFSYPGFRRVAAGATGFESVTAYAWRDQLARLGERPRMIRVTAVSGEFWSFFEATPRIGRFFGPSEDGQPGEAVAVLSYDFWRSEFGADPGVVGRAVDAGGVVYTVVGVAPAGLLGFELSRTAVFVPLSVAGATFVGADFAERANTTWLSVVGRPSGGDIAAEAGLARAMETHFLERLGEQRTRDMSIEGSLQPLARNRGPYPHPSSRIVLWLMGMSTIVVLIACANVATLMLGRALRRSRETAVRTSLGISARRIVLLPFFESLALALLGGIVAVPIGHTTVMLLARMFLPEFADTIHSLAPRSLVYTSVLVIVAGIVTAVVPAIHMFGTDLAPVLRGGGLQAGRRRSTVQSLLPIVQGALSALLLVGAGLFVRSVSEIGRLDLGYDANRVFLADPETNNAFDGFREPDGSAGYTMGSLRDLAATVPGVASVALAETTPFWNNSQTSMRLEDGTEAPAIGEYALNAVTPGYFEAMGTAILRGRGISPADVHGSPPVMVVSETLANTLWPGRNALGRCAYIGKDGTECVEVVGIAADIRRGDIRSAVALQFYRPWDQAPRSLRGSLVVRLSSSDAQAAETLRRALQGAVPDTIFVRVQPLRSLIDAETRNWYVGASVFSLLGVLALVMAAIGLFSVVAYEVAQRTREFGVRLAFGARTPDLIRLVLRKGVALAAAGVVVGLVVAAALAGRLEGLLFGVGVRDPLTFVAVGILLVASACVACLIPALRAARVDPQTVLRAE